PQRRRRLLRHRRRKLLLCGGQLRSPPSNNKSHSNLARDHHHQAVSGDTCQGIVNKYGTFDLNQFYGWNPAVGNTCSGLWLGYYYCIGTLTTTSTTAAPAPPAETCNPSAPTPTQPSAICGCKKWHLIGSGNTCDAITKQYGVTLSDFTSWTPSVGSTCTRLWLGYYVCVAKGSIAFAGIFNVVPFSSFISLSICLLSSEFWL
ncbi:hypothetical protein BDP67DRAFT_468696, partial [Colletotrichum lupini]